MSGRLAMPDAVDLLQGRDARRGRGRGIRIGVGDALRPKLDRSASNAASGLLTGRQAKIATDRINEKIAKLERRQQDQERLRVFDGHPAGDARGRRRGQALSPERFRAVLDVLMSDHRDAGRQGRARFRSRTGEGELAMSRRSDRKRAVRGGAIDYVDGIVRLSVRAATSSGTYGGPTTVRTKPFGSTRNGDAVPTSTVLKG